MYGQEQQQLAYTGLAIGGVAMWVSIALAAVLIGTGLMTLAFLARRRKDKPRP